MDGQNRSSDGGDRRNVINFRDIKETQWTLNIEPNREESRLTPRFLALATGGTEWCQSLVSRAQELRLVRSLFRKALPSQEIPSSACSVVSFYTSS